MTEPVKLPKRAPLWVREASPEKQAEWLDEYRAKERARNKVRCQTPEYKAYEKAYQQTPEYKEYKKAYDSAYRQTPEYKEYYRAYKRAYQKSYQKAYKKAQREEKNCLAFFQAMNVASQISQHQQTNK